MTQAQAPFSSSVLELPPDEFTDVLLDEREPPPGTMMIRLKRPEHAAETPDGARSGNPVNVLEADSLSGFESLQLSEEVAEAVALALELKSMDGMIRDLGEDNAARFFAHSFELSEPEAEYFVGFIRYINEEHDRVLLGVRVENCEQFLEDLKETGTDQAIENMAGFDRDYGRIQASYLSGVLEMLSGTLGAHVSGLLRERVSGIKTSMHSYRVDTLAYLKASNIDPLDHYQNQCLVDMSNGK